MLPKSDLSATTMPSDRILITAQPLAKLRFGVQIVDSNDSA